MVDEQIAKWRPYILALANRFQNNITSIEDLYHEGILGILRALKDFNPTKSKLQSYIFQCIKSQIICSATESAHTVHCPAGTIISNKKVREEQQCITHKTIHYRNAEDKLLVSQDKGLLDVELRDLIDTFDPQRIAHLYFLDGMNYREISEKFGFSITYISRYIQKVRGNIETEMKGWDK